MTAAPLNSQCLVPGLQPVRAGGGAARGSRAPVHHAWPGVTRPGALGIRRTG
ncbi:hypothetical protein T261_5859 [Streptomyces lydicus]|nr:hypothetical protein T261_5859 [Streptomyces lydicus]